MTVTHTPRRNAVRLERDVSAGSGKGWCAVVRARIVESIKQEQASQPVVQEDVAIPTPVRVEGDQVAIPGQRRRSVEDVRIVEAGDRDCALRGSIVEDDVPATRST